MTRRLFSLILALVAGLGSPALAQDRKVAVTFDDLPYQGPAAALCDPAQLMRLTTDFLAMLKPLDTHGTAFV
ncbi:MAG: polysaccharide deacetylase, partial [Pseudomonadota bacterium]|nr:polysaccharide deacetylase [Pseudomonadota bacterium]